MTGHELLYQTAKIEGPITTRYISLEDTISAMKEYARIKCKEQRDLCYQNAHSYLDYDCEREDGSPSSIVDEFSIKNAPEPKFD